MKVNPFTHEYFMQQAILEAKKAISEDEVPVGAVIVSGNKIIARAHNYTQRLNDVTAHAEMQVFTSASSYLGRKYLGHCTLYVTLEPCVMCIGASYWTQIQKIIYGASDEKRGFLRLGAHILHPKTEIIGGILKNECAKLLTEFFQKKR